MRPIVLALTLAITRLAVAQSPGIALELDSTTLEVGEVIDARLVCTNTGAPGIPRGTIPKALDVQLTSTTPSSFQQRSWVNGRRSRTSTFTYTMRITALKAGRHVLGPFSVEAGVTTYNTPPVTIIVREPSADSSAKGDRTVFVELTVDPTSVLVTQTITAPP